MSWREHIRIHSSFCSKVRLASVVLLLVAAIVCATLALRTAPGPNSLVRVSEVENVPRRTARRVRDSVKIHSKSRQSQVGYPVSVPRLFQQGEIGHFAQAVVEGSAVLTQCDVKNRWPDGSLQFAIVSFVIPSLPGNGSVEVNFQDQATGNNTGHLDMNGMLDSGYDFEGRIHVDSGEGIEIGRAHV